jgi:hypothetical protein
MKIYTAVKTSCTFDNLRHVMRLVYYDLCEAKIFPTHIVSGKAALIGYELLTQTGDPAVTTFKDLPLYFSAEVPPNEMEFWRFNERVAAVRDIS